MQLTTQTPQEAGTGPEKVLGTRRVLVVDDSKSQRRILSAYLRGWGYCVIEAGSGSEALEVVQTTEVDLIVSDWMMPGMNGLELCQAVRDMGGERYWYFILLTSKSEKGEVAHGLDVGADDFLTKPVAKTEFLARIRAGERILQMEAELTEKNRLITKTLDEISTLYESLNRDLVEAKNLQQSLVRERFHDFGNARVSLMLRPSGHVGGDLVGLFPVSEGIIGIFALDVSGHGVASALMTARLAGHLSGSSPAKNLALVAEPNGTVSPKSPSAVAAELNALLLNEIETEHYFTMLLGHVDLRSGQGRFAQCGHPHPVVQHGDGTVSELGEGGMPIGLVPGADWKDFDVQLADGDRLLLLSDGVTECPDPVGEMLSEEGLEKILHRNARLKGTTFFDTLIWELTSFSGDRDFPDDISAVMLEYDGPTSG